MISRVKRHHNRRQETLQGIEGRGKSFLLNFSELQELQNVVIIVKLCNWQRHIFFLIFSFSLFFASCGLVKYTFVCRIKGEEDEDWKLSPYSFCFCVVDTKNIILIIMSPRMARLSRRVHVTFLLFAVILNATSWKGRIGDWMEWKRQMTLLSLKARRRGDDKWTGGRAKPTERVKKLNIPRHKTSPLSIFCDEREAKMKNFFFLEWQN